jgi:hypothetical protein
MNPLSRRRWLCIAVALVAIALSVQASGVDDSSVAVETEGHGFAVVELFTSEGCSSCPAGEAALGRIRAWADNTGVEVHTIAWHVNYWDSLGWPDPYGTREASERQSRYARWLDSSRYTPQAIVNGRSIAGYAGDVNEIQRIVRGLREIPQTVSLDARAVPGAVRIEFDLADRRAYDVEAVLIEENLVSTPTAGENRNRELHHVSTVRSNEYAEPDSGVIVLSVPHSVVQENASIMILARPFGEPDIVAARKLDLPSAQTGAVSGWVRYADGTPAAGAILQFCTDTICLFAESDETGAFVLSELEAGIYVVKINENTPPREVRILGGKTEEIELVATLGD